MVEGSRYIEQYARMTPRERNIELRLLYEQLPASVALSVILDPDISDESRWPEDKRATSEHKRIIMDCLKALLSYSCLTDTGKSTLLDEFGRSYDVGVYKHTPEADAERIIGLGEKVGLDSEGIEELQEMGKAYARGANAQSRIFLAVLYSDDPNNNSSGIFDPERAPLLERQFYEWYKDYYSPLRAAYIDLAVEYSVGGGENRRVGEAAKNEYKKLEKWEEQLGILAEGEPEN